MDDDSHVPLKDRMEHLLGGGVKDRYDEDGTRIWTDDTGQRVNHVHSVAQCDGRPCVVHRPSKHLLKDWPRRFDANTGRTYRVCPHGEDHPDPDDTAYFVSNGYSEDEMTAHKCDGCCPPVI